MQEEHLARSVGSGDVGALSTPHVVALAEGAACEALRGKLEEGNTSVGTSMTISHLKASPVGEKVAARATVTEIDKRKVAFEFEVHDSKQQLIAKGVHERFVLNKQRFEEKLQ